MSIAANLARIARWLTCNTSGDLVAATSPAPGDDSKRIATTEWVKDEFNGAGQQLLSGNGYQKLPGGAIIQWGTTASVPGNSSTAVTFPIAFPTAYLSINVSAKSSLSSTSAVWDAGSNTGFNARNNSSSSNPISWVAIGY